MCLVLLVLAALAAPTTPAHATGSAPPREVTERLDRALRALDSGSFQGTYTVNVSSVVSKLDGSDREEQTEELEVVQPASGAALTHVVRAHSAGKDVTLKRQREVDEEHRAGAAETGSDGDKSPDQLTFSATLPAGENVSSFEFGAPIRDGELLVASFAPRRESRDRDGITTGRMAWRDDTLDPAWIEARPVRLPKRATELQMRFELQREGELLFMRRLVTDGAGGMLWIKRRIHAEVKFSEVHPAR